jgi:hypothetical protein
VSQRRWALLAAALAVAAAVGAGSLLLRPTATTTTSAGLTIECIGVDKAACAEWAASVLADGPGIHTFDHDDLERARLSRSFLGLFGDCRAEYFLGRYDDASASESVPCPGD